MSRLIILSAILGCTVTHASASVANAGRYLQVRAVPMAAQADLLSQSFHVRFDRSVKTIGDAMSYLLRSSGYHLASDISSNELVKAMLLSPLPFIDRDFGPMTLKAGLQTLAGPAFHLVSDPVYRKVSFILDRHYQVHQKTSRVIYHVH